MVQKDSRIKLVSEVLNGIKVGIMEYVGMTRKIEHGVLLLHFWHMTTM